MKKTITAEQLAEWFTLGTQFENTRIADKPTEGRLEEPSTERSRRMKKISVSGVLTTADLKPSFSMMQLSRTSPARCCLLTAPNLEHQLAELLVLLIAHKELKVLGFPGSHILPYELFKEAVPKPLLRLDGVRLIGISGEDEVLLGYHLVEYPQLDCSKCMRQVCEGMKEGVPILDEDDILGPQPSEDVSLAILLQASIVSSFCFLMGSKKLVSHPLRRWCQLQGLLDTAVNCCSLRSSLITLFISLIRGGSSSFSTRTSWVVWSRTGLTADSIPCSSFSSQCRTDWLLLAEETLQHLVCRSPSGHHIMDESLLWHVEGSLLFSQFFPSSSVRSLGPDDERCMARSTYPEMVGISSRGGSPQLGTEVSQYLLEDVYQFPGQYAVCCEHLTEPEGGIARCAPFLPPLASYEYPNLPITKKREKLISLIESNSVVIVRGATGSGKTTQLPQFILDHYSQKNSSCNIVVTQPRKIGAISIARWIAKERKCTLGSLVGYQVGLEKMATEHTRLIYMTTGVLLQKLVGVRTLTEFTHIFVDEIHERTEEMDLLLLVLKKLLRTNSRYVKIILMSATINCREFAEYFGTLIRGQMNPAYVFEMEGSPYAIEQFYLDDLINKMPYELSKDPCISEDLYNVAISLIQSFDEMEAKDHNSKAEKDGSLTLPNRGSVLVFLPGMYEICHMQEALAKLARKRLQVFCLHSTVTLEEQNGVFLAAFPGYRKIILSTNIAESSVTVPDVNYVIDFCLARRLVYDQETNYQFLCLTWASKNNCNQRKGRVGRMSKGYCYRLVTKLFWRNDIPEYMIPDMLLTPLTSIMLKVKMLDMGEPRAILSTALSPPDLCKIRKTLLQLKEIGALSLKSVSGNNEDGELTFLGRILTCLPVDPHLGKLVVLSHIFGCLEDGLIIAASLSLRSFFTIPSLQPLAGYRSKLAFARGTQSDTIAFVNAFKEWSSCKRNGQLRHRKDEMDWGKQNFIHVKRIREVTELYEELKARVSQFNMHVTESPQTMDYTSLHTQRFILQVVIAGAFYPKYFTQAELDAELASKEMHGNDPRTTVMVKNLPPYSFLYHKQLYSLFRQCGQVKAISFDGSRAYVEFFGTSKGAGVLPEVSMALCMNLQSVPLALAVYSSDELELCSKGRNISHMKYKRVNVDFQNYSVCPVGMLSRTIDPDKLPPSPLFVIKITEVVDVGHFWAFQADEASMEKQRHLTAKINMHELLTLGVLLSPNLLCLAPYSESNEQSLYYRAKILHIHQNTVEVFFVDLGITKLVICSSLRRVPSDLLSHPFQAHEFHIAGMQPSAQSMIFGNQWSSGARDCFITLVRGQSLNVVLYSILHGIMCVELLINRDKTSVSVADIMVKEGHAVKAEESHDSKKNHEALMSLYKDLENGTYVPNVTGSSCMDREQEEKEVIDIMLGYFSKHSQLNLKTKVRVYGPTSSYKTFFYSLNSVAHYKSVYIPKESINSVVLNENPQNTHKRMLVAGTMEVNATGTHFLLKNTNLVPDIPGLPALITMLFTPVMEQRTNAERTYYTGALCGLGWNSHTQEAILPEHDIELAFDVKIDVEDITDINALRMAINSLMCEGPNSPLYLGPDRIKSLQEDCQKRLIRLCAKSPPRESITPVYFEEPGKWNQVDPDLKMEVVQPAGGKYRDVLFQLHPVTLLNN
ncbi:ATP-dependent RNA helicase TDRD9 [Lampris incognitus]|uniref:ATP-dependent RNA helicase TDRD9 n=1 Tax=Lampris incognitus TaxID=2546036 RepID=UPI0024B5C5D8|nr:ATP-dependent RNA helicase TDRD9 [Lampris incognitus]